MIVVTIALMLALALATANNKNSGINHGSKGKFSILLKICLIFLIKVIHRYKYEFIQTVIIKEIYEI